MGLCIPNKPKSSHVRLDRLPLVEPGYKCPHRRLTEQNLPSMIAFVMNVSGQPMALYWAEGVVFLADFVEPEALPDEYVKGKIYASNVSHAPMAKYNNLIRVGNMEVLVIDVSSNIALRDLAQWIRENHQSASDKS